MLYMIIQSYNNSMFDIRSDHVSPLPNFFADSPRYNTLQNDKVTTKIKHISVTDVF